MNRWSMRGTRRHFILIGTVPACAVALSACGGSSGSSPVPQSSSSARPGYAPVTRAAGAAMELALLQLRIARYLGVIIRPGIGTTLLPPVQPTPTCNPATATATTATLDFSNTNLTAITAFYPPGDTTCSQRAAGVLEMYYPNATGAPSAAAPVTGSGYLVFFAPDGLPGSVVGAPKYYDAVKTTIYATTDGEANVDTELDEYADVPAGIAQPPPGTFPLTLVPPNPPPAVDFSQVSQTDIALVEHGANSLNIGAIVVASGSFYGAQTSGTLAVAGPDATGAYAVSAASQTAATAIDVQFVNVAQATPALGAATTSGYGFAPLSTQGTILRSYGSTPPSTTSYRLDGSLAATSQSFTDSLNAVNVTLQSTGSGNVANTFGLTATDQLRNAAATTPSPISLDAFGDSAAPFTFVLDPSGETTGGRNQVVSTIAGFGVQ